MRIPCPFCGERDLSEFVCRGEVLRKRPDPAAPDAARAFHDYLYLRDNPAGEIQEHWYHAVGCRNWMVVHRNTLTHVVAGALLAKPSA